MNFQPSLPFDLLCLLMPISALSLLLAAFAASLHPMLHLSLPPPKSHLKLVHGHFDAFSVALIPTSLPNVGSWSGIGTATIMIKEMAIFPILKRFTGRLQPVKQQALGHVEVNMEIETETDVEVEVDVTLNLEHVRMQPKRSMMEQRHPVSLMNPLEMQVPLPYLHKLMLTIGPLTQVPLST